MSPDATAQQLHVRASVGEKLTVEEQARLDAWYAQMDQEESTQLGRTHSSPDLEALQTQIHESLTRLVALTQRIQKLTAENEDLRREVLALERQLALKRAAQPA